jgi:hypothetical protein
MQAKNETFLNFLRRTDNLAVSKGLNVGDLIPILGLSRATLFSYRTGKRPISSKAWRKLEAAEKAAGINQPMSSDWNQPLPPEVQAELKEAFAPVTKAKAEFADVMEPLREMRADMQRMQQHIDNLTGMVEQLLEQRATSSSAPGQTAANKRTKTPA